MIFKPRELDFIEQHYMNWLDTNFAVNVDNGQMTAMKSAPQVILESRRATYKESGVLRNSECFMRLSRSKKTKGSMVHSPSLKALFIPNETGAFELARTGLVVLFDDKAPMFARTQQAYTDNHNLLCKKVSDFCANFSLSREAETSTHPSKIMVQGYGNVKLIHDKGKVSVILLDFVPMERAYNVRSLRRRFVKDKLRQSRESGMCYE